MIGFGNDLVPSTLGVDVPGLIYLVTDFNFQDGIVFAFSAYIRELSTFHFQVWRPVPNDTNSGAYSLVFGFEATPTVTDQREDVSTPIGPQDYSFLTKCFNIYVTC